MNYNKKYAIIVAGGSGTRLGSRVPKQFLDLNGFPVIWWSMKAFLDADPDTGLILVLPREYLDTWTDIFLHLPVENQFKHKVAIGGETRTESVRKGLRLIENLDSLVAIHDAARPLVDVALINRGWECLQTKEAAIPVIPVTDSLRKVVDDISVAVDRSEFRAVQTPQVFKSPVLLDAYNMFPDQNFFDDASVVEKAGCMITLFEGSHTNMKVTNKGDLEIAGVIMKLKYD